MKDESGWRILTKFVVLRAKGHSYLTDDGSEDKKAKGTKKKHVIKRKLKFENFENIQEATQIDDETKYLQKNKIDIGNLKK